MEGDIDPVHQGRDGQHERLPPPPHQVQDAAQRPAPRLDEAGPRRHLRRPTTASASTCATSSRRRAASGRGSATSPSASAPCRPATASPTRSTSSRTACARSARGACATFGYLEVFSRSPAFGAHCHGCHSVAAPAAGRPVAILQFSLSLCLG